MNITYRTVGTACTTLEERKEYGRILPADKGYLTEKAEYALRFPRIRTVRKKDGTTTQALLQQLVVSAAIRADEFLADFYWHYKAEVCFDMSYIPPKPFLSKGNVAEGPSRRHSLNPFPPGYIAGFLRRPDIIIVESSNVRWPGLPTSDHEGSVHPGNLRRVVEMKFPGDLLPEEQRDAYLQIAGDDARRLVIVDVNDCYGDLKRVRQELQQSSSVPLPFPNDDRTRAPVRSRSPIAEPAFYEQWLNQIHDDVENISRDVKSLIDEARRGIRDLSVETQAWLRRQAAWLFEAGKWIRDAATGTWIWINESGQAVVRWTQEILIAAWREVQRQTDLAWEQIKEIDWGQIVITVAATVAVVALALAGAIVVVAISEALLAALLALLAIGSAGALATA
ncbi:MULTISPECIES: VRR-NUC domain-containing protein [unclassified Cupriavidus]|uniref:VRR-NUC domain-containing protein n=1 Tax=unclassified Cupriavidus TaxID=2640874 RepID=UPI0010F58C6A|nr:MULTISPECIES: VRR-NUC domain-containing protein [unclassified Cupriavidus]MWL87314.1 VRR-NUC domain-containing protein [Cupriavidus sp. SW-Y-13]